MNQQDRLVVIIGGLLASGHYTELQDRFDSKTVQWPTLRKYLIHDNQYNLHVVDDAIDVLEHVELRKGEIPNANH